MRIQGRRSRRAATLRIALVMLVGALVLSACLPPLSPGDPLPSNSPAIKPVDNVAFHYQPVPSDSIPESWQGAGTVVVRRQGDEQNAVDKIHASGAKAYRYFNPYWYPVGSTYDAINIGAHRDDKVGPSGWTFCLGGNVPATGRFASDKWWFFIDLNERAARNALVAFLRELQDVGYDGVMFDRGAAALMGGKTINDTPIWYRRSTCTADPVIPGQTFADAYRGLLTQAHALGLETMLNYGFSPFHEKFPMRPDPTNMACRTGNWDACPTLGDVWPVVDTVIDENPSRPGELWLTEWLENYRSERDPVNSGKVVGLVKVEDPLGMAAPPGGSAEFIRLVYFKWASAKLFNLPLAINTGDDYCLGATAEFCYRQGTRTELDELNLGRPQGGSAFRINCDGDSYTSCIHVRRYSRGMVLVNNSSSTKLTGQLSLNISSCRRLWDLKEQAYHSGGQCRTTVNNRGLLPQTAIVYRYDAP